MLNLYSVRDVKANRFSGVIAFPNDEMAHRAFKSAVNTKNGGLLSEFPEDAQIHRLGKFDDEKGVLYPDQEFLWNGTDFVLSEKEVPHE